MTASRREKTIAVYVGAAMLAFATAASAQNAAPSATPPANAAPDVTTGSAPPSVPTAPVGKRQPRPADIPVTEKPPAEVQVEKLQDEVSPKLNICKGC